MTLQLRSLSLGAFHHLQAWCALVALHQAPRFERSHANYNRTTPACALVSSTTDSRTLSHNPNSIEFA
jgi:hypothetical protein